MSEFVEFVELSKDEKIEKYYVLWKQIKELEEELGKYKPAMVALAKKGKVSKLFDSNRLVSIILMGRKKWGYSVKLVKIEKDMKLEKKEEQKNGKAKILGTTEYVTVKEKLID